MVIAVTYDKASGEVYPHLGMATAVKIYHAEDGKVVSSEVVDMKQPGHGPIAAVFFGHGANVVICGGIRPSAAGALETSGLELYAGAKGDADAAVEAYLAGKLAHDPDACVAGEICGHDD
jgi:predicted Fe-Mo cluster-binding NifX family protein